MHEPIISLDNDSFYYHRGNSLPNRSWSDQISESPRTLLHRDAVRKKMEYGRQPEPFSEAQHNPASDQGRYAVSHQRRDERRYAPQQHTANQYVLHPQLVHPETSYKYQHKQYSMP